MPASANQPLPVVRVGEIPSQEDAQRWLVEGLWAILLGRSKLVVPWVAVKWTFPVGAALLAAKWREEWQRVLWWGVALALVGNLGYIAEVQVNAEDRQSTGNYLYGAYGRDFETSDGRIVYVVAITRRQWQALGEATGLAARLALIEPLLVVDLSREGDRFRAREAISAVLAPWFRERTLEGVRNTFAGTAVCWGPYQTFRQMVEEDPRCSTRNSLFAMLEQPGIGSYLVPGSPLQFSAAERVPPRSAPRLGEHTDEVLSEICERAAKAMADVAQAGE